LTWIKDKAAQQRSIRGISLSKEGMMKARDVMVSPVVTVKASSSVKELAKTLLKHGISGVPVVDDQGKLVGVVSEGDLLHRAEAGTERRHSWWLRMVAGDGSLSADYTKAHARKVADVMTRDVVTATPGTPLNEVAMLLEKNSVKRIPIVDRGQLVGIVTRANLVQVVASAGTLLEMPMSDANIRDKLLKDLRAQPWMHTSFLNVTVKDGIVDVWGMTDSDKERKAIRVAAENTPGVRTVNDHLMRWTALAASEPL
jgi:CBS-domain-containing membrane protein